MENLLIDIIELTLPISLLIMLLLLCSPLLKHSYVAKWRYYMWLFVGIRLILPFKINIDAPIKIPVEIQSEQSVIQSNASDTFSVSQILTVIWIIGMLICALYQIVCYISFKRLVKRWSKPVTDNTILNEFDNAKRYTRVSGKIEIKVCKAVTTPIVFGLVNPTLFLPDIEFNSDDLPIILKHELVHFKRHDIWYKFVLMTAKTIHWFNPVVHLMFKAADKDIELACDAEVVKNSDFLYRRRYCEAILRLVHNGSYKNTVLSTCFIFSKKTVMERFKNILDEKIKRSGIVTFCIVAVSIILSGSIIAFAAEKVAYQIEENLQIIERPTEKPQLTETPLPLPTENINYTAKPDNTYIEKDVNPKNENNENISSDDSYNKSDNNYSQPSYTETTVYEDDSTKTTDDNNSKADINIEIGEERENVYEKLGEPDSVSEDGSKEVYNLSDGNTAVLQYEDDVLGDGYILVE